MNRRNLLKAFFVAPLAACVLEEPRVQTATFYTKHNGSFQYYKDRNGVWIAINPNSPKLTGGMFKI